MILDRIGILRAAFPRRAAAADAGARWARAARAEPGIAGDVIRLGRVLAQQPDDFVDGYPMGRPIDPLRLAFDAGRRDLALQLLALIGLTPDELRSLMERDDD